MKASMEPFVEKTEVYENFITCLKEGFDINKNRENKYKLTSIE
jgi:hypothetical protein